MARVAQYERFQTMEANKTARANKLRIMATIWLNTNVDMTTFTHTLRDSLRGDCVIRMPRYQESEGTIYFADEVDLLFFRSTWEDEIAIVDTRTIKYD